MKFSLTVIGDSQELLGKALDVAFTGSPNGSLTHYAKTQTSFELFTYERDFGPNQPVLLPVAINYKVALELMVLWLYDEADYPKQPETDGDCTRGFFFEALNGESLRIIPQWMIYGK